MNESLGILGLLALTATALAFLSALFLLSSAGSRSTCACGLRSALRDVAIFSLIGVNTLLSANSLAKAQEDDRSPSAAAKPEAESKLEAQPTPSAAPADRKPEQPENQSENENVNKPTSNASDSTTNKNESTNTDDAAKSEAEPVIGASLDTIEIPPGRPAWINQSPNLIDRVQTISVASGPYALEKQARRALDAALVQATKEYITDQLGSEAAEVVRYDAATLKKRFVKPENTYHDVARYSVGPMHEYFALLELDRDFRKELDHRWKKVQASERVSHTGVAAGASLFALFTAFTFFRFRCRRHGSPQRLQG